MQNESFEWAQLISGYLLNKLSEEDEIRFMDLVANDPEKKAILDYYKHTAPAQERLNYINSLDIETAWQKTTQRHNKKQKKTKWPNLIKYVAALVVLTCSVALWFMLNRNDQGIVADHVYHYKNDVLPGNNKAQLILSDGRKVTLDANKISLIEKNGTKLVGSSGELVYTNINENDKHEDLYNTLIVPRAGIYNLQLPDGTRVWLNAMSELRFPLKFSDNERRIELRGEGYFEVAKDAEHPFKIALNGSEIEVLGTTFNTSCYGNIAKTTLIEGSVKIKNSQKNGFLKPGQQGIVQSSGLEISRGDIDKATAWRKGYFYFSNDAIQPVLEEIARWYDLKITYKTKMPSIHIGGSISRKVKLSEVLQMLKDVSNLSFEIDGRNLTVN
ncbi:FecR family protein [Pedobacter frigoris]|uniref:DUF4974 domain-containing protein n=1 Tax=Pedobacter frigoris TaxID=2571272 RepID=A0A4U1CUN8_9SPHI|nr:FecR family protein [Pedobacter frigoris]TKC09508.1 DUF4974 domain-containing protein [Pedobacter frigoris]